MIRNEEGEKKEKRAKTLSPVKQGQGFHISHGANIGSWRREMRLELRNGTQELIKETIISDLKDSSENNTY